MTGKKANLANTDPKLQILSNEEALWDIDVVFKMVCGAFKERADRRLEIGDVEARSFRKLLSIACGKPAVEVESQAELIELARLADEFQMDEVKGALEDRLLDHLNEQTCVELLMAGMSCGLSRVEQVCRTRVLQDFELVATTPGFVRLSEDAFSSLLDDDFLRAKNEEVIFEGLARWLLAQRDAAAPRAADLLAKIRFPQMYTDYLETQAKLVLPGLPMLDNYIHEALGVKSAGASSTNVAATSGSAGHTAPVAAGQNAEPGRLETPPDEQCRHLGPRALIQRVRAWELYEKHGGERRLACTGLVSALAHCGGLLCSGSLDGTMTVWDAEKSYVVRTLQAPESDEGDADAVSTAAAARGVVDENGNGGGGGGGGGVRETEGVGGEIREEEGDQQEKSVLSLTCFDGCRLASGHGDGKIHIWDPRSGQVIQSLVGHADGVWALVQCGPRLLSGSDDRTIRIWAPAGGASGALAGSASGEAAGGERKLVCERTLVGHTSWVVSLVSWQGRVVSGSMDSTVRVWDLESGAMTHTLEGHGGSVFALAVVPQTRRLVTGAADQLLRVWALGTWELLMELLTYPPESNMMIRRIVVSGSRLVGGSVDVDETNVNTQFQVLVWNLETLECLHVLKQPAGSEVGALLAVNGRVFAGVGEELVVWRPSEAASGYQN